MSAPSHATHSHAAPSAHSAADGFDAHGHKHGHTVIPLATLRLVLTTLLFFTLLTVGLAQGEAFIAETFNIVLPQILNVFIALTIATIKTIIVVMIFMQLKYDNPINSMVFIFTIVTVAFFLGFTTLDLGNRQTIDRFKGVYIVPGGTGLDGSGIPITAKARNAAIANAQPGDHAVPHAETAEHAEPFDAIAKAGYVPKEPNTGSSAQRSRPVKGLTLPGLAAPEGDPNAGESEHAPKSPGGH